MSIKYFEFISRGAAKDLSPFQGSGVLFLLTWRSRTRLQIFRRSAADKLEVLD
ncbi:MAG: hypothetical protein KF868_03170 [Acidobacteria bacterium]|nr:hypothetical protein [Acidobacteriota bacterium]MCW5970048.1 hypothetical protein [Blastocatellales bacterium]